MTYRVRRIRNVVKGEPVILVQDGEMIARNRRNERLRPDELMEQGTIAADRLARSGQVGRARNERLDQLRPEAMRLLVAAGVLAMLAAGCNGGTVDNHALQRDAEKIASLATEGELLANDVSKGASTNVYARVHAKELSEAASNLQDALAERPTSAGIESDVRKASGLAGKVAAALEQLHLHPTDRGVAEKLKDPLSSLADDAGKLAK